MIPSREARLSTYIIGDVHGRYRPFQDLLEKIDFKSTDRVIFVGDLVNVGFESAEVVRWAMHHNSETVLGNHDLHMLAVIMDEAKMRPKDTFQDILDAPDRHILQDWLLTRPLVINLPSHNLLVVHGGLLPSFTPALATQLSGELEAALQLDPTALFKTMYGNEPRLWSDELAGEDRLRIAINTFTRARILKNNGELEFDFKNTYETIPAGYSAWFDLYPHSEITPIFGHWSALGCRRFPNAIALDSGAAWCRDLTAYCVDSDTFTQVPTGPL